MDEVKRLVAELKSPDSFSRRDAIEEIGKLAPHRAKEAIPALIELLVGDKDARTVAAAERALVYFGVPALPALKEVLKKGKDNRISSVVARIARAPYWPTEKWRCGFCGRESLAAPAGGKCPNCGNRPPSDDSDF